MRSHARSVGSLVALCLAVTACGCGGSADGIQHVHGTAKFAGQPIVFGSITFVPNSAAGHEGPAGTADIVAGKFDTSRNGQGIKPGPHLVRITAMEEQPPPSPTDETQPSPEVKPPLFAGYTIEQDVKGGQVDFEVPESARGFDLLKPADPKTR